MIGLAQQQTQQLNVQQIQNLKLLQLNTLDLTAYLQKISLENPMIDLEDSEHWNAVDDDRIVKAYREKQEWLTKNDYQNRYYYSETEEIDVFGRIGDSGGLEETLNRHLHREADRLNIAKDELFLLHKMIDLLDENGYLRADRSELAKQFSCSLEALNRVIMILQSMEPIGVGAANLSECFALQLVAKGASDRDVFIVKKRLSELVSYHWRSIQQEMDITDEDLRSLLNRLKELEPRPSSGFESSERLPYVEPDILVREEKGELKVFLTDESREYYTINPYYRSLMKKSDDPEVKHYLADKLRQAEALSQGIRLRKNTLRRLAELVAERQADYLLGRVNAPHPLTMTTAGNLLGLNVSTVSRAAANKYVLCPRGMLSLSNLFSRAVCEETESGVSREMAKSILQELIRSEDPRHPLTDQKLCEALAMKYGGISRRTVAKYRAELNIPGASGRKRQKQ